jgi:hypothetical protein
MPPTTKTMSLSNGLLNTTLDIVLPRADDVDDDGTMSRLLVVRTCGNDAERLDAGGRIFHAAVDGL